MKKISIFLVSFILLFVSFAFFACTDKTPPRGDTKTVRHLNEHNSYIDSYGYKNDLFFTNIVKTESLAGEKDDSETSYFILEGTIDARGFSFNLEHDFLELYCKNTRFYIPIDPLRSQKLSDITLSFGENQIEMKGDFKLVFELEGENAEKFAAAESGGIDTSELVFISYSWGRDKSEFVFLYSQMEIAEKY